MVVYYQGAGLWLFIARMLVCGCSLSGCWFVVVYCQDASLW